MSNALKDCGCARCLEALKKMEPVLTRAEAEARLTDEVLDRASRAYAGRYQWRESQMTAERRTPMRDVLLAALFPEGGQG